VVHDFSYVRRFEMPAMWRDFRALQSPGFAMRRWQVSFANRASLVCRTAGGTSLFARE